VLHPVEEAVVVLVVPGPLTELGLSGSEVSVGVLDVFIEVLRVGGIFVLYFLDRIGWVRVSDHAFNGVAVGIRFCVL